MTSIIKERFERRKISALVGNLDFFGAIQKYESAPENTEEKEITFKSIQEICNKLKPNDVRVLLAYIQKPRNTKLSDFFKDSISRSNLNYEEWLWAVNQTFFVYNPKK